MPCPHGYYSYCYSCKLEGDVGPGTTPVDEWQRNRHSNYWSREARRIMGPALDEIQRDMLGLITRIGP